MTARTARTAGRVFPGQVGLFESLFTNLWFEIVRVDHLGDDKYACCQQGNDGNNNDEKDLDSTFHDELSLRRGGLTGIIAG